MSNTEILTELTEDLDMTDWLDIVNIKEKTRVSKPKLIANTQVAKIPQKPTQKSITSSKSKQKGNAFENKIAKSLGIWIFNDENAFTRSITSGAKKAAYYGDIVPLKQLGWKSFPFIIEAKNGYKNSLPTMMNWTMLSEWLIRYDTECTEAKELTDQYILFLICGFHNYSPLLFTNIELANIHSTMILRPYENDTNKIFYSYDFKTLWNYDFYELLPSLDLRV